MHTRAVRTKVVRFVKRGGRGRKAEAARHFGVPLATVYRWVAPGPKRVPRRTGPVPAKTKADRAIKEARAAAALGAQQGVRVNVVLEAYKALDARRRQRQIDALSREAPSLTAAAPASAPEKKLDPKTL